MGTVLFVLGMHRSGTSALSRVLALAGARLPPDLCLSARDNPTGFWEPRRAIELNDAFVIGQGSSLYDPSLILQATPPSEGDRRNFVLQIRGFFETLDVGAPTVIKDPRISVLLPFWLEGAKEAGHSAVAVQIFRNPNQVARSLAVRQNMAPAHALALWSAHNLFAERDGRSIPRLFVSYDDLLSDWRSVVSRCADELGLRLFVNSKVETNVATFLKPSLQPSPRLDHRINRLPWSRGDRRARVFTSPGSQDAPGGPSGV